MQLAQEDFTVVVNFSGKAAKANETVMRLNHPEEPPLRSMEM